MCCCPLSGLKVWAYPDLCGLGYQPLSLPMSWSSRHAVTLLNATPISVPYCSVPPLPHVARGCCCCSTERARSCGEGIRFSVPGVRERQARRDKLATHSICCICWISSVFWSLLAADTRIKNVRLCRRRLHGRLGWPMRLISACLVGAHLQLNQRRHQHYYYHHHHRCRDLTVITSLQAPFRSKQAGL